MYFPNPVPFPHSRNRLICVVSATQKKDNNKTATGYGYKCRRIQ